VCPSGERPQLSRPQLSDILEELEDKDIVKTIAEGRRAIKRGVRGILVRLTEKESIDHKKKKRKDLLE